MCEDLRDFAARRQTNDLDRSAVNDHLVTISNSFGEEWLQADCGNPLQLLWHRRDFLSTLELSNLGYALKKAININPTWVNSAVRIIKSNDINNQKGMIYEIIAIGLFHQPPQNIVELPRSGRPGYDLIVRFQDDSKVLISLKSYGASHWNSEVIERGKELRDIIRSNSQHCAMHSLIIRNGSFPTCADWNILRSRAQAIASRALYDQPCGEDFDGWSFAIAPLRPLPGKVFCQRNRSDALAMLIPFHRNEEMNLISKLNDACENLSTHGELEAENSHNLIMVRIPEDIHISRCVLWAQTYFRQHPEKPISGVILYQTGLVTDQQLLTSTFTIAYQVVLKETNHRGAWMDSPVRRFHIVIQAGTIANELPPIQLTNGLMASAFTNHYVYQEGDHYYRYEIDNGVIAAIKQIGGVKQHAVLVDGNNEFIVQGIFPPEPKLMIL